MATFFKRKDEGFDENEKRLIERLLHLKQAEVDLRFLDTLKSTLLAKISEEETTQIPTKRLVVAPSIRFSFSIAGALILVIGIGSGAAWASQNSLPGDLLYPVKLVTEQAKLVLAPNKLTRANLHVQFAEERLQETSAIEAGESFDPKITADSLGRFQSEIDALNQEVGQAQNQAGATDLLPSLLGIEQKLVAEQNALENIRQKLPSSVDTQNKDLTDALDQSEHAAAQGLEKTRDKIFDIQRATHTAIQNDPLASMRLVRAIEDLQARVTDLQAQLANEEKARINMLSKVEPTISVEKLQTRTDKEITISNDLENVTNAIEAIKGDINDQSKYLVLLDGIYNLRVKLDSIAAELGAGNGTGDR